LIQAAVGSSGGSGGFLDGSARTIKLRCRPDEHVELVR
jgi:hypothetical protein